MQRIGPYELRGELGRGGMAVVYRGRRPGLDRDVAIKVLVHPELDLVELERFELEVTTLAQVRHPGIVTLHDAGRTEQGLPWLAVELVEGRTLQARLEEGPLGIAEAVGITRRLCDAVTSLHRVGVLHRDIKPANVLIDESGAPRLTDFGVAQLLSRESRLTQTGELLGTPSYMAPEQARGEFRAIGPAADVYGLGATLYACLTGAPPFQAGSVIALLHEITTAPIARPSALRPDVDPGLDAVCVRSLAKAPGQRFGSAEELGWALEAWAKGERTAPARRSRAGAIGGLILVGAVGCALGALALRSEPRAASSPAAEARPSAPPSPSRPEKTLADLAGEAERALQEHRWAAALAACDEALRRDPNCAWARSRRGLARHRLGRLSSDVLRDLDAGVALAPTQSWVWVNRARVRADRGDSVGGLSDMNEAIRLEPKVVAAYLERGFMQVRLKAFRAAEADFRTVERLAPGSAHALTGRAVLLRFSARRVEALAAVESALRLEPNLADALEGRALLLNELNRHREAIKAFDRHLEVAPGNMTSLIGRAASKQELGDLHGSLRDIQRALERMPAEHETRPRYEAEIFKMRVRIAREAQAREPNRRKP